MFHCEWRAARRNVTQQDFRRRIPRTDALLALPEVAAAAATLSDKVVRDLVRAVQDRARRAEIAPEDVPNHVIAAVTSSRASSLTPVLNATGVIVHTNLGRAPLSEAAQAALVDAAGYVDVEFDVASGARSRRGVQARAALLRACPAAEDALPVNNGAAALVLATTALAGHGGELVLSRGELIEIGAGFRLTDLMESTGAVIREVGTTNRTHIHDYTDAVGERTTAVLKVHASNYVVKGFTSEVGVAELAHVAHEAGVPLIVDIGSGLLTHEPALPSEPAIDQALRDGADIVIASGDKLLGGPQAGILYGKAEWIQKLARHPLARAVRADKLMLAALEATLTGPIPPVTAALRTEPRDLKARTVALADAISEHYGHDLRVVPHDGRVGGGGGAEVPLPGWALELPESCAAALRACERPIVAVTTEQACLMDLRCVPADADSYLAEAVAHVLAAASVGPEAGPEQGKSENAAREETNSPVDSGRHADSGNHAESEGH